MKLHKMVAHICLCEVCDRGGGATHPVLHASLSILIESAVMTKASAHARCPM